MDELHEQVMEELCSGEERRRKEREDREYERNLSKSLALTQQQMMQQANQLLNQAYDYDLDKMVGVGTTAPSTKLDVQSLAGQSPTQSGPLNSIKKALGI
jgi:hypothetical protein